jgi:hypothetical protein
MYQIPEGMHVRAQTTYMLYSQPSFRGFSDLRPQYSVSTLREEHIYQGAMHMQRQ